MFELGLVVATWLLFFFQAEDGIRDLVRSRGLGDVYKRQPEELEPSSADQREARRGSGRGHRRCGRGKGEVRPLSLIHI